MSLRPFSPCLCFYVFGVFSVCVNSFLFSTCGIRACQRFLGVCERACGENGSMGRIYIAQRQVMHVYCIMADDVGRSVEFTNCGFLLLHLGVVLGGFNWI